MQDLGTLGGNLSEAQGINVTGQVTGWAQIGNGQKRAFLYSNGSMQNLGALSTGDSTGIAVKDLGPVVGFSKVSSPLNHAFFYSNGTMQDLGTIPGHDISFAYGVNNLGQTVGTAGIYDEFVSLPTRAFLHSNGDMMDLNNLISPSSGWILREAYGINDSGPITGWGTHNGQEHAFLLNVPGPGTMLPLLLTIFSNRRRR